AIFYSSLHRAPPARHSFPTRRSSDLHEPALHPPEQSDLPPEPVPKPPITRQPRGDPLDRDPAPLVVHRRENGTHAADAETVHEPVGADDARIVLTQRRGFLISHGHTPTADLDNRRPCPRWCSGRPRCGCPAFSPTSLVVI